MAKDKTKQAQQDQSQQEQKPEPKPVAESGTAEEAWKTRENKKLQKIIDGKKYSIAVIAKTEEARSLASLIEQIDDTFQEVRNSFGAPRGISMDEFYMLTKAFAEEIAKIRRSLKLIQKRKYKNAAQYLSGEQKNELEDSATAAANVNVADESIDKTEKTKAS